jgi:hypothetical protein
MSTRPQPLENGYLWLAHTAMRSAQVRQLEEKLSPGIRFQMERRDISELGDASDTDLKIHLRPAR